MNLHTVDWNKFRTFYDVVKAASFTKAAKDLHISQPALSRRIASLEESLNVRLLERVPRGVVPTEEGKALLETLDAMLNTFLRYEEKFNNKNDVPQGLLKVAISRDLPCLRVTKFMVEFLEAYPQIRLALLESAKEMSFTDYRMDAAIKEFNENAEDLEQIYLSTSSFGLYASTKYLQQKEMPVKVEDLDQHILIALGNPESLNSCPANWVLEAGLAQGKQRMPNLCVRSISEMKKAVELGLGVAALPEEYVEGRDSPPAKTSLEETKDAEAIQKFSLVRVLPDLPSPSVDLYYVFPRHHKETKRITAYGEFLAERFKAANCRPPDDKQKAA